MVDARQNPETKYAAHTDAGTFLLDAGGICHAYVPSPDRSGSFRTRNDEAAERCVGAQYVASIDVTEPGALVQLPRIGAALLLGVVDSNGRISLVRTPPIIRFETIEQKKESLLELEVSWDDESTAAAPKPQAAQASGHGPATSPNANANASEASHREVPAPPESVPDAPTRQFRPADLLAGRPPPSGPFSDEPPTPAAQSIRRAVPLGSAARLAGHEDTTEVAVESRTSRRHRS